MRDWRDGLSDEIRKLEAATSNGAAVTSEARGILLVLRGYETRARKVALRSWDREKFGVLWSGDPGSRGHGIAGRRRQGR